MLVCRAAVTSVQVRQLGVVTGFAGRQSVKGVPLRVNSLASGRAIVAYMSHVSGKAGEGGVVCSRGRGADRKEGVAAGTWTQHGLNGTATVSGPVAGAPLAAQGSRP